MTVRELREKLEEMPDNALVMMEQQLIGDQHYIESVTYKKDDYRNPKNGVVWLGEIRE